MPKAQLNISRSGTTAAISVPNYDGQDQVVIRRADAFRPSGGEAFAIALTLTGAGPENDTGLETDGNYAYQGSFASVVSKEVWNVSTEVWDESTEIWFQRTEDVRGDIITTAGANRTL